MGPGDRMGKAELLARIRQDRTLWEETVATVPRDRLTAPELPGGRSIKDAMRTSRRESARDSG